MVDQEAHRAGELVALLRQDAHGEFLAVIMPLDLKEDPFSPALNDSKVPVNLAELAQAPEPVAVSA